ncbi:sulfite exporter TauE/SafE family protein [Lentilactobacillus raoultii]|uniref:Probable membrane transporter protein n=1 Tax=Lentilactobacillus raoultii TaxID=1987503 RepID=A0ABW3PI11_9LACO|nr:sulfite exporter TauE/SafE family protein [Lentilactobacillus raoultii]
MAVLLIFLGFLIGAFIISMGGGGGSFYLGVLVGIAHLSPAGAAATSLFTALPALAVGTYSHYRTGNMKFSYGNKLLITALPATVIGSLVSGLIPVLVYNWVIAIILFVLGVQTIRKSFGNRRKTNLKPWTVYLFGALSGLMVGVAGLSGGGPVMAGLLLLGLNMPQAAATSSYALIALSIVGLGFHFTQGNIDWQVGLLLMVGSLVGAAIMPRILAKFDPRKVTLILRPVMGILLVIMAVRFVV